MTDIDKLIEELRHARGAYPLDSDTVALMDRAVAALAAQAEEIEKLAAHRDVLIERRDMYLFRADAQDKAIREALDVVRSSSVPLGVSEARHWDRLLAESRRILTLALDSMPERSTE